MLKLSVFVTLCTMSALFSCGKDSNIWCMLVTDSHKQQFHVLVNRARAAFDRGDYDEAVSLAENAWAIDPKNEDASIILGFSYLGKAGVAPFDLARALIASGEEAGSEDESTSGGDSAGSEDEDAGADPESGEGGSSEAGTSGVLGSLSGVFNLSNSDVEKLGTLDTETDPNLPLLIPYCAFEARGSLENLTVLNKAIAVICPYVSDSVRLEEDYRHVCEKTARTQRRKGQADFLWAFAHLSEALAFDKVINYKTGTSSKTNLELRMEAIEASEVSDSPADLQTFVAEVESLKSAIDRIIPSDGVCESENPQTQFQGMLNDLVATVEAFKVISGIPKEMTEQLEQAMEGILSLRDKATSGPDVDTGANDALKGDITGAISDSLSSKIDEVAGTSDVSDAELEQLCQSYASISGGSEDIPEACSGIL